MAKAEPLTTTDAEPAAKHFRRRVFYIPGYDPIHPRRYRELYRKEAAEQAEISGYSVDLEPKKTKGPYGWRVRAQIGGHAAEADIDVLVWSDIVRDSMSNSIPATYLQLIRTAWAYIGSGALFRLMRLRKGPMIAALYPIVFLLFQLAIAVALAVLATQAVAAALDWLTRLSSALAMDHAPPLSTSLFGQILSLSIAALAGWAVLVFFRRKDNKIFAYYLMHDYAYSAQSQGANPPELEARMAEFGTAIRSAMSGDYDEVLVVGHSSGAHLGVSILSDLLRAGLPADHPPLGFLSLGHVVPMVSFLPKATRLRADLAFLSARPDVTWIDVTAPGDGCAFALCDPVAVSGVAPPDQRWPLIFSAAFTQTLSPERWKALRWRFFRLHFQYLCAFDRPGDYDYFQITAGPQTLADRYGNRAPSKSRIVAPVNRYTSIQ